MKRTGGLWNRSLLYPEVILLYYDHKDVPLDLS